MKRVVYNILDLYCDFRGYIVAAIILIVIGTKYDNMPADAIPALIFTVIAWVIGWILEFFADVALVAIEEQEGGK